MSIKTIQQNLGYEIHRIGSDLNYFKPDSAISEKCFAEEISHSLQQDRKYLNPKFFYDKTGSKLFEKICSLPEYYLTRKEIEILGKLESSLIEYIDEHRLVELGSGSSTKTRLLLNMFDKVQDEIEYIPIDISDIISESSQNLQKDYDNLRITGIIDTYEAGLEFVKKYDYKPNLIVFLGSSFGNFSPEEGFEFLKKINNAMREPDLFLIGLDLIKEKRILEMAYDDSQGITAQFNLNILKRINHELDGNFDLEKFAHVAHYNEDKNRIEMYLRSLQNQSVHIAKVNISLSFEKNELIHTENSHKFSLPTIQDLFNNTGFTLKNTWQDENNHYVMILASKK